LKAGMELTFADLLRRHRASADITQEELAERSGLTPQAIGLLERGQRRYPQAYTVQKLAEALELAGRELAEFESVARRPAARHQAAPSPRALPAFPTSLVGREHEATVAAELLGRDDVRLLTLTGPGGVGKTRLALEAAARVAEGSRGAFADGAVFVPLAPLRDPGAVSSALAEALGVRDIAGQSQTETLKQHLRDAQILVVLDNFEHLAQAVNVVADLLGACRGLTVLTTSRASLRITGEYQFPVSPLPLPEAEASPGAAGLTARSAAVELFCQRARAVAPAFGLDAANAATIAEICRRLDGLPLAIELAAARVKMFSPRALLERLDRRLQVLAGGARDLPERQRTLRDAIAWSYELLDAAEQALFRSLSVFSGGCTLEAVEAVYGSEKDQRAANVLETLASLVDNSLLGSRAGASAGREDGEPRFTMLETIREYSAERLESCGEAERVRQKHALYYLKLAEAAQPETIVPPRKEWWWTPLEEEHDNLRAALHWTIRSREVDTATRLALALWRFWTARHLSEGRRWLEAVLEHEEAGATEPAPQARRRAFLLLVAGILAARHGDYDRAVALDEESLALYRDLGHRKGTHAPLRELGTVAYHRGAYDEAVRLSEQALAVAREFGSASGSGLAVCNLADALRAQGDLERARVHLEESLSSLQRQEEQVFIVNALVNTLNRLGSIACEMGEDARAAESYGESLGLMWRFVGRAYETVACLEGLASVAARQGRPERSARLLGASAALREEMGTPLPSIIRADHKHASEAAHEALGEAAFEAAWAAGYAMLFEEAITYALENADTA
jgi:predicted ATPase/DNA-binding XRE family transcriptional regulator